MPLFYIPRRSGEHRTAAIALYRALLTQCRALPHDAQQRDELQNITRNRFRQARNSVSIRRLRIAFCAGYEAIDQLDAAVAGHEASREYIAALLDRAPAKVKQPLPVTPRPSTKLKPAAREDRDTKVAPSIFDRPLPLHQLSGKRHIPVLFQANSIPVLRIKKPQPPQLSGYLANRIRQRQSRNNLRWRLHDEKSIAAREDEWDELVEPYESSDVKLTTGEGANEDPAWTDAVDDAITDVQGQLAEEKLKNQAMAAKMQAVVDRERQLLEAERAERRREKRRAYRRKRKQSSQVETTASTVTHAATSDISTAA